MNTQTTSQTPNAFKGVMNSDRTIALLGLAAHHLNSKPSHCPSDEELAAFISGEYNGKKRQAMLAHLNHCSTCYSHWLEVTSYLDSIQITETKGSSINKLIEKWWQKGLEIVARPLDNLTILVPATAVLLIAAVVWMIMPLPTLSDRIDASFEVATTLQNADNLTEVLTHLSTDVSLGVTAPSDTSPAVFAFNVGVEMGRATLAQDSLPAQRVAWANSQWAEEYELGRWMVLLWSIAQTPQLVPVDFWSQQQAIGETLQARFSKRSSTDAMTDTILEKGLKPIISILSQLQNDPDNYAYSAQLTEHLELVIEGILRG